MDEDSKLHPKKENHRQHRMDVIRIGTGGRSAVQMEQVKYFFFHSTLKPSAASIPAAQVVAKGMTRIKAEERKASGVGEGAGGRSVAEGGVIRLSKPKKKRLITRRLHDRRVVELLKR